ncbi:MAG TPA: hypothetical protein VHD81_01005 [Mycobacteriales bacterium]|nr:hypothetical protein [Mycobacteriales bacterium]
MTQPRLAQPARFAVAAIHNASRTALVIAVATVAVAGAGAAVAVSRTASPKSSLPTVADQSSSGRVIATAGGFTTPSLSSATPSPDAATAEQREAKSLLAKARANALARRSVHAVARFVTRHGTAVYDNRDALHHGEQHLTIQGGHITIRVVGSTTYYTGDKRGLVRFFLYTPRIAAAIGRRWVPLIAGNRGYRVLTDGVTLGSLLDNERIVGRLQMLPQRRVDGVRAIGIQGEGAGGGVRKHSVATWWISTGEHPLPVEFDASTTSSQLTQTFTDWGRPVHVKRPHAIFG